MKDNPKPQAGEPACVPLPTSTRQPCRILVADDESGIRRFNAKVLKRYGYEVDIAEDGAAAWEALQTGTFHLLITDHDMPKLTGIELVKKLRSARMALPVILATGGLPAKELVQDPSLQLAAMLPKPFSIDELLETVRVVLRATDTAPWADQAAARLAKPAVG